MVSYYLLFFVCLIFLFEKVEYFFPKTYFWLIFILVPIIDFLIEPLIPLSLIDDLWSYELSRPSANLSAFLDFLVYPW